MSEPNVKAAAQPTKDVDDREPGELSEVSDVENTQLENPRQGLGQDDRPAVLSDMGIKAVKSVKDISELLADMNVKKFEMIQRMASSVGTKLKEKFSKMFG